MGQSDILEIFHFPAWEINLFGELPWDLEGFPGSSTGKESTCNAGDLDLIPGLGRSREGNGNPLQYSFLENCADRGGWLAIICGVTKTQTH